MSVIEKYIELTKTHPRQFLFDFDADQIEELLSLKDFNTLLHEFIDAFLMNNPRYDFAKYCAGIDKFEHVTAGDSRPIAMANLFYQNVSADVCRQLAAHMDLDTSMHYFTNVDATILASSIMGFQRRINAEREELFVLKQVHRGTTRSVCSPDPCMSPLRPKETGDISDCGTHYTDCFGCRYYVPSEAELTVEFKKRQAYLDDTTREVIHAIAKLTAKKERDIDELYLHAHTAIARYRQACDLIVEKRYDKWQERKNTVETCC